MNEQLSPEQLEAMLNESVAAAFSGNHPPKAAPEQPEKSAPEQEGPQVPPAPLEGGAATPEGAEGAAAPQAPALESRTLASELNRESPKGVPTSAAAPEIASPGANGARSSQGERRRRSKAAKPPTTPYSEDAEKGVICSLLHEPGPVIALCHQRITASSFFIRAHEILFDVICEWPKPDSQVDHVWLRNQLTARNQLDEVGGIEALNELYSFGAPPANAQYYIDTVREKWALRCIIEASQRTVEQCLDRKADLHAILKQATRSIEQIAQSSNGELPDEEKRGLAIGRAIIKGEQLNSINLPPKAVIIDPWCKEGNIGFVFAFRGTGKTWFVLHLCTALATGTPFGPWPVTDSWPVLYVDGEMTFEDDKSRLLGLAGKIPEQLRVLNHEVLYHFEELVMNLARPLDQQIIRTACLEQKIKILVLDNLSCLFTGVDENDAAEWEKIQPWLLQLRRDGIAVIIVLHTGVDASRPRGTTKREDPVDWTLRLDNCKQDFSEAGAHFISKFRKYRGKVVLDYEWWFGSTNSEVSVTFKEARRADLILRLVEDGLTRCEDIATELGVTKGTVSKFAKTLINEGKLKKRGRDYEIVEQPADSGDSGE